ncbi:MAG: 4Fe-4S ferredoxin [Candidatus Syntrophoarchaeum butanivorans]|uniref:4Fe-4S ferredoxin n=2 Tax=Candidatus Syntropharchaeum TaxID=1912923 RepID=A0A1F2P8U3_9EURY|nr:MAG: 4Fe-4S ferredoxin [Candidatus Syntrophoarchaeum butanivorans]OFV67603.1 MAG: 4Fe-4S ferredoxin [Candidatus Syntrophoarchaeum caldarius]
MVKRLIIKIDEEKCDGCGECVIACEEGALEIIDGKAKVVKESLCDGLGACIGECPQGALTIEEREAEAFLGAEIPVCPSTKSMVWEKPSESKETVRTSSELRQWPVLLNLVSPQAPYFKNADLLLVADCVPVAYPNFHADFLKNHAIAVGCPKFDDVNVYLNKVTEILKQSDLKSLTVLYMEVPCCFGLVHLAQEAVKRSGMDVPFKVIKIGIKGEVIEEKRGEIK